MKRVIQEDATGCGIAAAAAIAGISYRRAKRVAASMGIEVTDSRLWSDTEPMRRLLARFGLRVGSSPKPFSSWQSLPDVALLAIKWHRIRGKAFWHWTVFVKEERRRFVLDSKPSLKVHPRTDFGRMRPKWFLPVHSRIRTAARPSPLTTG